MFTLVEIIQFSSCFSHGGCIKVLDAGWGQEHGLAGVELLDLFAGLALSYQ